MSESSTTPTPETPSLAELRRLREAAHGPKESGKRYEPFTAIEFTDHKNAEGEEFDFWAEESAAYLSYAANHSVSIAERLERENAELRAERDKWSQRAIDEQADHHKTLDAAEKAAEHIELQNVAIRGASEAIDNLQAQLADERKHGDELAYLLSVYRHAHDTDNRVPVTTATRCVGALEVHAERRKP